MHSTRPGLRIAVLGTRGFPGVQGGIETHCENLYTRLAARDCRILVFARHGYVDPGVRQFGGVRVQPLWAPRNKNLEALTHTFLGVLRGIARRRDFDIIHIHGTTWIFVPLARLSGCKVVVTSHGPEYERSKWGPVAKAVLRAGEFLGARFASSVIAVSRHTQELLWEKYQRRASYIPNGVDFPVEVPARQILERFGLEPGRYILSVGRLVPEKGFHDLLQAFSGVETEWRLVIAGGADHEDAYSQSLKRAAAADPRVVMTGRLSSADLSAVYSAAAFFVLPSHHEGLSISILEAMSHRLPVLASRIPANMELVDDDRYTFPPGQPELLEAILVRFVVDGFPPDYVAANTERLENEFDWEGIADRTLSVYRQVVGGTPS